MEASEKIYVSTDPFGFLHAYDCENHPPIVEEYIRKDAFIEKAKNWLYLQLNEVNMEGEDMENFIEDFKTYMKGE